MNKITLSVLLLALSTAFSAAHAQKLETSISDWNVMTMQKEGRTICYIGSKPVDSTGTFKKRGEAFVLVTMRDASTDEVSVTSGYPYAKDQVSVDIEGKTFAMFSEEETAWAPDDKQDKTMIDAMKKGKLLIVKGTSQKDTASEDTYSLKGFSSAYKDMKKRCTE
jgi:hypothetical protein